jgi:hypothetical protein
MILSENRLPPRIECGAGFFRIMLYSPRHSRISIMLRRSHVFTVFTGA